MVELGRQMFFNTRTMAWSLVLLAFAGVWVGAKHQPVLVLTALALLPANFFACRRIVVERGYPFGLAWCAFLFGPFAPLVLLGLPDLTKAAAKRPEQSTGPDDSV